MYHPTSILVFKNKFPKFLGKNMQNYYSLDSEMHIFNTMLELSLQVILYNIKLNTQTQNVHN